MLVHTVMQTTEIRAAIKPYSIAVAPDSSEANLRNIPIGVFLRLRRKIMRRGASNDWLARSLQLDLTRRLYLAFGSIDYQRLQILAARIEIECTAIKGCRTTMQRP